MRGLRYKWMAPFSEHFRYRKHTGMVAWAAHRLTGIGIAVFAVMHIWSISRLARGADAFNATMALYSSPLFRFGEIVLFAGIVYHALNGLRIIAVDFFGGARYHKALFWALMAVGVAVFVAGTMVMTGQSHVH